MACAHFKLIAENAQFVDNDVKSSINVEMKTKQFRRDFLEATQRMLLAARAAIIPTTFWAVVIACLFSETVREIFLITILLLIELKIIYIILFIILLIYIIKCFKRVANRVKTGLYATNQPIHSSIALNMREAVSTITYLFRIKSLEVAGFYESLRRYQKEASEKENNTNWISLLMEDIAFYSEDRWVDYSDEERKRLKCLVSTTFKEQYDIKSVPWMGEDDRPLDIRIALLYWRGTAHNILKHLTSLEPLALMNREIKKLIALYKILANIKTTELGGAFAYLFRQENHKKQARQAMKTIDALWKEIANHLWAIIKISEMSGNSTPPENNSLDTTLQDIETTNHMSDYYAQAMFPDDNSHLFRPTPEQEQALFDSVNARGIF